jgi:hypothetical protein
MYKTSNLFYLLLITVTICACSAAGNNSKSTRDFDKFPAASTQEETRLMDVELQDAQLMTIYKDSLLLVVNNLNRNPYHVRVFDIGKKRSINNVMPVSRKKGGALSFMSFDVSDSLVWVFDVAKNGFIAANLETVLNGDGDLENYSEYKITPQVFYYDAILLNRNEGLLSGNYDTDEKLMYINFTDSSKNRNILSYEKDSSIGSSRVNKMSYESFMLLKPDKKQLLLACRYADQFELLDLSSGAHKKVRGPEGFPPQLDPFENNAGVTVATPGQDARYGFLKGHVTDKFIYLLFSGNNVRSSRRFYSDKIYVYDWNGNPIRQINLKNDIVNFSVTSDDKILYTLNPQTRVISFSQLKW